MLYQNAELGLFWSMNVWMITLKIADQRRSDFYVVFALSHCTLKQTLASMLFEAIQP